MSFFSYIYKNMEKIKILIKFRVDYFPVKKNTGNKDKFCILTFEF